MVIPESQFDTWSNQGAIATSMRTHESIRNALDDHDWPVHINFEIYLQGSYKNDTNIRGDSDVDVVVQLKSAFYHNLTEEQCRGLGFGTSSYNWMEFQRDVVDALNDYYGVENVQPGNKAIKVDTAYLPADVVVCQEYRKYSTLNINDFVEGMKFYVPNEARWVKNYPKIHYNNGVNKNSGTNGWFKPTVRLFKNARTYMINQGQISDGLVPSYFLECLLYNVSSSNYGTNYQTTFCNIVNCLSAANLNTFICQNGQQNLLGDSPEQWSLSSATRFLSALINLWNTW
jgi:hypothetical protein